MSTHINTRDALALVESIRKANVAGQAIAVRTGGGYRGDGAHGFLGGIDAVLHHFLLRFCGKEAALALSAAMDYLPTDEEIAAHNADIVANMQRHAPAKATGAAT